jgi:hypothetical protein
MTVADLTYGVPAQEKIAGWGLMTVADVTYGLPAQVTIAGWGA